MRNDRLRTDSVEKCLQDSAPPAVLGRDRSKGEAVMMGRQSGVESRLFYSFNLDAHVPSDHLLRRFDQVLDLANLPASSARSTAAPAVPLWTRSS